jgi:ankyrin repeat protein
MVSPYFFTFPTPFQTIATLWREGEISHEIQQNPDKMTVLFLNIIHHPPTIALGDRILLGRVAKQINRHEGFTQFSTALKSMMYLHPFQDVLVSIEKGSIEEVLTALKTHWSYFSPKKQLEIKKNILSHLNTPNARTLAHYKEFPFPEQSALHWACEVGSENAVKLLIDAGAKVNEHNLSGRTPLQLACKKGNERIVRALIEAGANLSRALHDASNASIVAILLEASADIDEGHIYAHYTTPLYHACQWGNVEVVKALIDAGASLTKCSLISSLLQSLNINNQEKIALILFEAGLTLSQNEAKAFLYWTCDNGFNRITQTLINDPGKISYLDLRFLLPYACSNGNVKIVKALIRSGVRLNAQYKKKSPLQWACTKHFRTIAKALIDAGDDVDQVNRQGLTLLHLSCMQTSRRGSQLLTDYHLVKALIDAGANMFATNERGFTPFQLAYNSKNIEAMAAFMEAGIDFDQYLLPPPAYQNLLPPPAYQ